MLKSERDMGEADSYAAMVARLATTADPAAESLWTFGFGSNMNVALLRSKKGLGVLESAPGVVKGWRMSFRLKGMGCVEPSFADAQRATAPGVASSGGDSGGDAGAATIHGVAVRVSLADYAKLSRQEAGYDDAEVEVEAYDGRRLSARLYTTQPARLAPADIPCSERYLGVLVSGASEAGLDPAYIEALRRRPTYVPTPETLARRAALPLPASLPPITVGELWDGFSALKAPVDATRVRVSVMGYVFDLDKSQVWFSSHRGRDITARTIRQFRGLPLDANDDWGKPPFTNLATLDPGALAYATNWLDDYMAKEITGGASTNIVGFLAEFLEEQGRFASQVTLSASS